MAKFEPPETFAFDRPSEWQEWKERFTRFRLATKLHKEDGDVQVSSLIYAMGSQSEVVFKSFALNDNDSKDYGKVLQKFDEHFIPKRNVIFERCQFGKCVQREGESVETFVRNLYTLSEHCGFAETRNQQIRDRIVVGILDKQVSQRLQMKTDLTLDTAIEISRHSELVKNQNVEIRSQTVDSDEVTHGSGRNIVYAKSRGSGDLRGAKPKQFNQPQKKQQDNRCTRCNRIHARDKCPAKNAECRRCHRRGHYERCCKTKNIDNVTDDMDQLQVEDKGYFYLGSVDCSTSQQPPWNVSLRIQNKSIQFKIDSGADVSIMCETTYKSLQPRPKLKPATSMLRSPGGTVQTIGEFTTDIQLNNEDYTVNIFVVKGLTHNLLSRTAAVAMGLIQRIDEINDDVFGDIGLMKVKPVNIALKDDVTPYAIHTARRVPIPLLQKVEAELKRMEQAGVIAKVTEPTDWCAPMVPVLKPNGNVRICVDLRQLNKAIKRERYTLPTMDDVLHKLSKAKYFSRLDASSGFYQIPLDEESSKLTCFMTPMGRYVFRRLPFGITSAPEIFSRIVSELLGDLECTSVFMDDVFVGGENPNSHDRNLDRVLDRVRASGLALNKEKFVYCQTEMDILGHKLSANGISPHPDKVKAIQDLNAPTDISELRRFLGMVNYLGQYLPNLSELLQPLNELLKSDKLWIWGETQDKAFSAVKQALVSSPVLAVYDVNLPTMVSADASRYGLGGVLLQLHGTEWKPVAYASKTLTETEKRYAQIEKECLASVWCCEKFSRYLVGLDSFRLITDHKPLVPLMNSKDIDQVPIRCQRLLMRLMRFNPIAEHAPGKTMVVADTLSRSPLTSREDNEQEADVNAQVNAITANWPISDAKLDRIRLATENDEQLASVIHFVRTGWPRNAKDVPENVRDYFSVRERLSTVNGLLTCGVRMVIPHCLRDDILDRIHDGHQGMTKCSQRANQSVWWPGITKQIQTKVSQCSYCQVHSPSLRKEPLKSTPLPQRPWQQIAADILQFKNKHFLLVIDYFSRYFELVEVSRLTSSETILKLKAIFARFGTPDCLITDNGTNFVSREFKEFQTAYNFQHTTVSPHHHQANGEVERAVATAKKILGQKDPFLGLMMYRSTPTQPTGCSPAELLMGRPLKTTLPILPENLTPRWPNFERVREVDSKSKSSYERNFNSQHGVRELPELKPGDTVRVKLDDEKGWTTTGVVKRKLSEPRSYNVETSRGNYRRNRRHVKPAPGITPEMIQPLPDPFDDIIERNPPRRANQPNGRTTTRSGRVINPPKRYGFD